MPLLLVSQTAKNTHSGKDLLSLGKLEDRHLLANPVFVFGRFAGEDVPLGIFL